MEGCALGTRLIYRNAVGLGAGPVPVSSALSFLNPSPPPEIWVREGCISHPHQSLALILPLLLQPGELASPCGEKPAQQAIIKISPPSGVTATFENSRPDSPSAAGRTPCPAEQGKDKETRRMSLSTRAATAKHHRLRGLGKTGIVSHVLGAGR